MPLAMSISNKPCLFRDVQIVRSEPLLTLICILHDGICWISSVLGWDRQGVVFSKGRLGLECGTGWVSLP